MHRSQGVDTTCVLCKRGQENRDHRFFDCLYSQQIWKCLAKGIMGNSFTYSWSNIMRFIMIGSLDKRKSFCFRYAFQEAVYALWRVRNRVKHGERLPPMMVIKKLADKGVRNKLSLLRSKGVKGMQDTLQIWFFTRL